MFRIHPTMGALWRGSRGYKQNESIVLCGGIDINIMNSGDHILISKDRRVLYFAFCFVLCCADADAVLGTDYSAGYTDMRCRGVNVRVPVLIQGGTGSRYPARYRVLVPVRHIRTADVCG